MDHSHARGTPGGAGREFRRTGTLSPDMWGCGHVPPSPLAGEGRGEGEKGQDAGFPLTTGGNDRMGGGHDNQKHVGPHLMRPVTGWGVGCSFVIWSEETVFEE